MEDTGRLNLLWSHALIGGMVAAGVRQAVISPGSRSTPLALAALRTSGLKCHIAVDERSAAFFALGTAKASGQPGLLIATSGTAPANWLPAIVEACQAGIPLIALSADRPPELQHCGANQTIDQNALFAPHVRHSFAPGAPFAEFEADWLHRLAAQMVSRSQWPYPGPVHCNQAFREPLFSDTEPISATVPDIPRISHGQCLPDETTLRDLGKILESAPGLIFCGEMPSPCPDFAPALSALAEHLAAPVIAEPLSGLRFGPHDRKSFCTHYAEWLKDPDFLNRHRPEWLLRFGNWPVTRQLQNWLTALPRHLLIDPWPRHSDPSHKVHRLIHADPTAACRALLQTCSATRDEGWRQAFLRRDQAALAGKVPWHIPALLAALPENSALFLGNSLAIREFDNYGGDDTRRIYCYGNRGCSGIDGNIATALGIGEIHGQVVALIGDLTCQHDLGSLALCQDKNAVMITVNNGGGGIFDYLPQAKLAEFERGWRTPQQLSFAHAAATFGINYAQVSNATRLHHAVASALQTGGSHLLEIVQP